jgi:hypothetical protein
LQKLFAVLYPFQKFVDENQEQKDDHTELKQKAKLVITSLQTFNKDEFVQRKHTQDNPLNGHVNHMQIEGFTLNLAKLELFQNSNHFNRLSIH